MSDKCPSCESARVRSSGVYHASCNGCAARAIARSLTAWNALHPRGDGNRGALTEMVARLLPKVPADQARRMVLQWWKHDKSQSQQSEAKATCP